MVIPSQEYLKNLPLWYIPQKFRIPNTILIRKNDSITNKRELMNLPIEHVSCIKKVQYVSVYTGEKDYLSVGCFVVLYAPDFPLGKVKATYEKYYSVVCDNNLLYLKYDEPIFRMVSKILTFKNFILF